MASCVSSVVSCLPCGEGLEPWLDSEVVEFGVFGVLWLRLDDLAGGGGDDSPRPAPFRLNPLRLRGSGGRPCNDDIAILSIIL